MELPHALATVPHSAPPQLAAGQTHWLLLHCSPAPQPPQVAELPHEFERVPHALLQSMGLHWQTLSLPQVSSPLQEPQAAVRAVPQLSGALTEPHVLPSRAQNCALVSG